MSSKVKVTNQETKLSEGYSESLIELTKLFLAKVDKLKPRERKAIALLIERLSVPPVYVVPKTSAKQLEEISDVLNDI